MNKLLQSRGLLTNVTFNKLQPVTQSAAERSRGELAAIAHEYANTKPDVRSFSLKREHRNVLKDLRNDENLVIIRPDKGRATVIMKREDYIRKMTDILGDGSKFLPLGPCDKHDNRQRRNFISKRI